MNVDQKFSLIKRNLQEVVTEDELKSLLENKKTPSAYIGMACSGKIHVGYFVPLMKIKDFLDAGFKFKVLLADLHAHLDDNKAPFELLDKRVEYYKQVLKASLLSIGADIKNLEFVRGSDFQLEKDYMKDTLKLSAINTLTRCKRAASEVVRFGDEPKLSGFIYPIMQALDEQYLDIDVQFGGIDQRKILMFARENLPRLKYKPRIEVMTPMLPGLTGDKMSSSVESSKIDMTATSDELRGKVKKAFCPEGEVENNGVLAFFKQVIMTLKEDADQKVIIKRSEKWGGNLEYSNYEDLEADFIKKVVHPMDLKAALAEELEALTKPIRDSVDKRIIKAAYPK